MSDHRAERARERLASFMAAQGKKNTRQREVIVDVFLAAHGHHTITELLEMAKERDPRVGYATVYRTMKMLTEARVALERHFGADQTRYELLELGEHHDHLICTSCHCIIEYEDPIIEERQLEIAARYGFEIRSHRHEIYGTCKECQ